MSSKLKKGLVLATGILVTGVVSAHEVTLNDVTDYYVNEASHVTTAELQNEVYSDILNTAHKVQLQELEIETRVLISFNQQAEDITDNKAAE